MKLNPISNAPLKRSLSKRAVGSFALYGAAKALMFLASVLLARLLGAEAYGIYAFGMAAILMLGVPLSLGLPTLLVRFTAAYHARGQWGLVRGLHRRANQTLLAVTLLSAFVLALLVLGLEDDFGQDKSRTLLWAAALLPLGALSALRGAALRGFQYVVSAQLPESLVLPGCFVVGLLVFQDSVGYLRAADAMMLRVIATIAALLAGWWMLSRLTPPEQLSATPQYEIRSWARSAIPLTVVSSMSTVMTQTDVVMLTIFRGTNDAGIYQAAARGAELIGFSVVIVNAVLQPTLSRLFTHGELGRLQYIAVLAARLSFLAALPVAVAFSFFSEGLMAYAFGEEFTPGASPLIILSVLSLVVAACGPAREILTMTGHEHDAAVAVGVGALSNVLLNALLIPAWGPEGAAYATGTSMVVWNAVLVFMVRRRLGVSSIAFARIDGTRRGAPQDA